MRFQGKPHHVLRRGNARSLDCAELPKNGNSAALGMTENFKKLGWVILTAEIAKKTRRGRRENP
jgi:hypothetical protein